MVFASHSTKCCRALTDQTAQRHPHRTLHRIAQLAEVRVLFYRRQMVGMTCLSLRQFRTLSFAVTNLKRNKTMRTRIWHLLLFGLAADLMDKSHVDCNSKPPDSRSI